MISWKESIRCHQPFIERIKGQKICERRLCILDDDGDSQKSDSRKVKE